MFFLPCDFHVETVNFFRQINSILWSHGFVQISDYEIRWTVFRNGLHLSKPLFIREWHNTNSARQCWITEHQCCHLTKWNRVETWTWRNNFFFNNNKSSKQTIFKANLFRNLSLNKTMKFCSSLYFYGFGNFYWESQKLMKKFRVT